MDAEISLFYETLDIAKSALVKLDSIEGIYAAIEDPIYDMPPRASAEIRVVRLQNDPVTLPETGAIATMF